MMTKVVKLRDLVSLVLYTDIVWCNKAEKLKHVAIIDSINPINSKVPIVPIFKEIILLIFLKITPINKYTFKV